MEDKYRERDEQIMQYLLSDNEADAKHGLVLVDETYRKPVASVLVSLAWERGSEALATLLDPACETLDPEQFSEVWQCTLLCVWENVLNGRFKSDGSLLAYLVTIAYRRTIDQWRWKRGTDKSVESMEHMLFADNPSKSKVELIEAIEQFYKTLSAEDQVALRVGLYCRIVNGSRRGISKMLVKEFEEICREKEWNAKSGQAIVRQHNRLRGKLRKYLEGQGYHVI